MPVEERSECYRVVDMLSSKRRNTTRRKSRNTKSNQHIKTVHQKKTEIKDSYFLLVVFSVRNDLRYDCDQNRTEISEKKIYIDIEKKTQMLSNENKQSVNIVSKKLLTSYLLRTCLSDQSKYYRNICGKVVYEFFNSECHLKKEKPVKVSAVNMVQTASPQPKLFPKTIPTLRRRVASAVAAGEQQRHGSRLSNESSRTGSNHKSDYSCHEKTVTNAKVAVLDDNFLSSFQQQPKPIRYAAVTENTSADNAVINSTNVGYALKNLYVRRNRSGVCYQSGDVDLDLHDDMHLSDIEEQIINLSGCREPFRSGSLDTIEGEM